VNGDFRGGRAFSLEEIRSLNADLLNTTILEPSGIPPIVVEGWDELAALKPPEWILGNVIHSDSVILLFGAAMTLKTFTGFSLMASVLLGKDFAGRPVKKGKVLYLAAEGKRTLFMRLQALAKHHSVERIDGLRIITSAPQLGEVGPMEALMEVLANEEFDLIVIDTGFKHFSKFDPSSALGALALVSGCEDIRRKTGAAVMLIHHAVKGGRGKGKELVEFGGAALMAGVDTAIAVDRKDDFITLSCKKQKSEEEFEPIRLQMKLVTIDTGDGGKRNVPVITDCDSGHDKSEQKSSSAVDSITLLKVLKALRDLGRPATAKELIEKAGTSQATFHRLKDTLIREHLISQQGERQPYEMTERGIETLMKLSETSHES